MIKKILLVCAILLGAAGAVNAETIVIRAGDTLSALAHTYNTTVGQLQRDNKIADPNRIYVGELLEVTNEDILGLALPEDNYDSNLTTPLDSSTSTIFVNALPTNATDTIYTIFGLDGRTVREKVYCTGKSTSANRLTGCVRGLRTTFSAAGVIDETAGTGVSHSKNARIAITDNINFTGKTLSILSGYQGTSSTNFILGNGTSTTVRLIYQIGTNTTTAPWIGFLGGVLVGSEDGSNSFRLRDGGSGLTAGRGIGISAGIINLNLTPTSTSGLTIDAAGTLSIATSTNGGIRANSNGLVLNTSSTINWQAPFTFGSSTIFTATSTMATSTISSSTIQFLNATNVSSTKDITINGLDGNTLATNSTTAATNYHYHAGGMQGGQFTSAVNTTGALVVNHGLGVRPSFISFTCIAALDTTGAASSGWSRGSYTSSTNIQNAMWEAHRDGGYGTLSRGQDPLDAIQLQDDGGSSDFVAQVVALSATNFTLNVVTNVNAGGTRFCQFEAFK